jgi:Spy/CpxP family protein refolding chaperone
MKHKKTTIGLLAFGLIVAITAVAFAHGGYGRHMGRYKGHNMMGPGYGGGHMMDYGPQMRGYDRWGSLSEEDAAKIDAARDEFYKETRKLRGKIDDVRIALRNEMERDQPNEGKVTNLQMQLSKLQAEFDQKLIEHRLKVGKLMPKGYKSRSFRGGYCW